MIESKSQKRIDILLLHACLKTFFLRKCFLFIYLLKIHNARDVRLINYFIMVVSFSSYAIKSKTLKTSQTTDQY